MALPSPPTDVTAAAGPDPGEVLVAWKAPVDAGDEASYEVKAVPTQTLHKAARSPCLVTGLEAGASYTFEVRTVTGEGRSEPALSNEVQVLLARISRLWTITSWAFVVLALAAAIVFLWLWAAKVGSVDTLKCLGFASFVILIVSLVLTLTGGRFGMWRMIIGQDRRVSTSYLQTTLWTGLVAFILAYFTARTWFNKETGLFEGIGPGGTTTSVWDDYLVLLGGPFAALVFARGIISYKIQNGTVQKTVADDGTAKLKQVLTSDDDNIDLVDSQYLIFNLVAFAYVIVALASTNRLPAIPGLLMALTSSSAATYVLNKAVQNNAPAVTGVNPSAMRAGDRILIDGKNFLPAGPDARPKVTIGGKSVIVDAATTASRITAFVPAGVPAGPQDLVVTTAANIATEPRPVEVLPDKPIILGLSPEPSHPGDDITVYGSGFISDMDGLSAVSSSVSVHFGDHVVAGTAQRQPSGIEQVVVKVPPQVPTDANTNISVSTARMTTSDPVKRRFIP